MRSMRCLCCRLLVWIGPGGFLFLFFPLFLLRVDASDTLGFFCFLHSNLFSLFDGYETVSFSFGVVGCLIHVTYRITRIN